MLKKFLAGLTAVALSLGMVALTAGPASAHHNTIDGAVACNTDDNGYWKITWTIENSENISETITASSDTSLVPVNTVIAGGATLTVYQYFSAVPASNVTLTLSTKWTNNVTATNSGTVKVNAFKTDCLPDTTDEKITICHATESDSNPYTHPEVSVASIITLPNGHKDHVDDIIPPFDYISQGVAGHYDGLNWTAYGQAFYNAGCTEPTVTPTAPTFNAAVCTATAGVPGQASYVIPTTANVKYTVQINGAGGYVEKVAGTYYVAAGTQVQVQAVALTGYVLGNPNYWSTTFAVPNCDVTVTPDPVTFSVLECVEDEPSQPSYTIPSTTGVTYEVRTNVSGGGWSAWAVASAGTTNVSQDTEVEVRAIAQTGYSLTGTTEWSASFGTLDCIVPTAPTFTAQICEAAGDASQASYTIPTQTGVTYEIWDGDSWEPIAADVYDVNSFPTTVTIRAVASTGYEFVEGSKTEWEFQFVSAGECVLEAPVDVVWNTHQACVVDNEDTGAYHYESGTITIPATAHVTYSIDGTPTTAGPHEFAPGVYTISAVAEPGYYLTGAPDPWTVTILADLPCGLQTFPSVTPSVTFSQTTCSASGSYTLIVAEPGLEDGVVWTVSGGLPNTVGKHSVNAAGTVTIKAVPASGFGFGDNDPESFREWSFDFTSLPDDCLPTLALTGTSIATGGLGLAGLLTLGGILMIIANRRKVAPIQD